MVVDTGCLKSKCHWGRFAQKSLGLLGHLVTVSSCGPSSVHVSILISPLIRTVVLISPQWMRAHANDLVLT